MRTGAATILLWLFVLTLGVSFGAGLYESRVVISGWADLQPQSWPNTGLQFWVYATTVPLTFLTLANSLVAWRDRTPRGPAWRTACMIAVVERLATFGYFIPTMLSMMSETSINPDVSATLTQWTWLNHGRHALTLAAWLAALKALSLSGSRMRTVLMQSAKG